MLKALFVYFVLVYKKQKFRPGTLVNGKRGGICCCKGSDFPLYNKNYLVFYDVFAKKNRRAITVAKVGIILRI